MEWFRYAFLDGASRYLAYDRVNDDVIISTPPKYLEYSPFDWKDFTAKVQRSIETFGVFRVYTLPVSFVKDASILLTKIFYKEGYEAVTTLVIEKRNHTTLQWELFIEAEIDYTNFSGETAQFFTKVNLMDNSVAEFIKSVEDVTQELDLTGPDTVVVNMDGVELQNKAYWVVTDGANTDPTGAHTWDMQLISTDSLNQLDVKSPNWINWTSISDFEDDGWFYRASTNKQFTLKWDVTIDFNQLIGASYAVNQPLVQILIIDSGGTSSNNTILDLSGVSPSTFLNQTYHLTGTLNFTPNAGDRFYFVTRLFPTPSTANFIFFNYVGKCTVELSFVDRIPANDVHSIRFFHACKKWVEKASNGRYSVVSNFLTDPNLAYFSNIDNRPWQTVLCSGDAQRGIANPKLKTTLNDLRRFGRTNWMLGEAVEGSDLRIEPLPYFFQKDSIIAEIAEINNFRHSCARDLLYSSVKIGYPEATYDKLNGRYEFNTTHEYKFPNKRVSAQLDLVSPIRADIFGIEYIRYERLNKDSTDSSSDDTVFAVEIEPIQTNGKYNILRLPGSKNGIPYPDSYYNFGLTPHRALLRNLPWFYSILPNTEDGKIEYRTAGKNNDLRTRLNFPGTGVWIDENEDVIVKSSVFAPTPLFKPVYLEFDCIPPDTLMQAIFANPYGVIKFYWRGNWYKGFLIDVGVKPSKRDIYSWKLLSTADNDLTLLKY